MGDAPVVRRVEPDDGGLSIGGARARNGTSHYAARGWLFPDYRDVVIPPNIAPLNFQVNQPAEEIVVQVAGKRGTPLVAAAGEAGKLRFDSLEWRRLLNDHRGERLAVTVYTMNGGQWQRHPDWYWTVAQEPIDPYLTYRLIEPSYELYRQLGLYERNLTNFDEHPIYENNDEFEEGNNHCVNCHTPQAYGTTGRRLFHVRSKQAERCSSTAKTFAAWT